MAVKEGEGSWGREILLRRPGPAGSARALKLDEGRRAPHVRRGRTNWTTAAVRGMFGKGGVMGQGRPWPARSARAAALGIKQNGIQNRQQSSNWDGRGRVSREGAGRQTCRARAGRAANLAGLYAVQRGETVSDRHVKRGQPMGRPGGLPGRELLCRAACRAITVVLLVGEAAAWPARRGARPERSRPSGCRPALFRNASLSPATGQLAVPCWPLPRRGPRRVRLELRPSRANRGMAGHRSMANGLLGPQRMRPGSRRRSKGCRPMSGRRQSDRCRWAASDAGNLVGFRSGRPASGASNGRPSVLATWVTQRTAVLGC